MGRKNAIPPIRCHATANRTGESCRRYAKPGTSVCSKHGGTARQVKDKAMEKLTLAELAAGEHRHPWEVVLHATHLGDALMRDAESHLTAGESLTPQQVDRLLDSIRFAHHMAETAIRTKSHEHIANAVRLKSEEVGEQLAQVVRVTIAAALDRVLPLPDDTRDPALYRRIQDQRDETEHYLTAVAAAAFSGDEIPPAPANAPSLVQLPAGQPDALEEDAEIVDDVRELDADELAALVAANNADPEFAPAPPRPVTVAPLRPSASDGHHRSPMSQPIFKTW